MCFNLFQNLKKFNLEYERGVWRYGLARAAGPVAKVVWDVQLPL